MLFSAFILIFADNKLKSNWHEETPLFYNSDDFFLSLGITFHPTGKGNLKENNHIIFAFPGNAILHVEQRIYFSRFSYCFLRWSFISSWLLLKNLDCVESRTFRRSLICTHVLIFEKINDFACIFMLAYKLVFLQQNSSG